MIKNAEVYSVSTLIRRVNSLLEEGFRSIQVEGEVSNLSRSGRGHIYFSLKDEKAQLECVLWASSAARLRFEMEDGLALRARGSLTIYPGRGRFQMVVSKVEPQGIGALQLAFEQLKTRLTTEGLFEAERKLPLPALPLRVGIVTSSGAAALRDMLKILRRSHPIDILLAPATVQGEGAGAEIAAALGALIARGDRDVIIVGRGGGSLEDLWAFNTEEVARAIAACPVPLISGVGHETDYSISDFVADLRAATPTHAAELVISRIEENARQLRDIRQRIERAIGQEVERSRRKMRALRSSAGLASLPQKLQRYRLRLEGSDRLPGLLISLAGRSRGRMETALKGLQFFPGRILARGDGRLIDSILDRMVSVFRARLLRSAALLSSKERALGHLSPRKILQRGYSITMIDGKSQPLRNPSTLRKGMILRTIFAEGSIRSLIAEGPQKIRKDQQPDPHQGSLFENGGPDED